MIRLLFHVHRKSGLSNRVSNRILPLNWYNKPVLINHMVIPMMAINWLSAIEVDFAKLETLKGFCVSSYSWGMAWPYPPRTDFIYQTKGQQKTQTQTQTQKKNYATSNISKTWTLLKKFTAAFLSTNRSGCVMRSGFPTRWKHLIDDELNYTC